MKDTAPSGGGSLFPVADCGGLAKSLPLTTDWTALESMVDTMNLAGMTNVTIGMMWGWHALTPNEPWSSGLTSLDEAKRSGFIGICEVGHWKFEQCEAWMKAHAANGEHIVMTTRRYFLGMPGPATAWNIFIVPPAK